MPINAQNRSLPDWFTRIRTGQTVLPRFQRFEAWSHSTVTQMFNTILRGLPVGATLVLEIGNEEPFISRKIKGAPDSDERVTEHLLDGQQRLTGLWRGLHNNYEERTYFLYLTPNEEADDETDAPHYVYSIARWRIKNNSERRPFWTDNPKEQWKRRMIPLHLFNPDNKDTSKFRRWAKSATEDRDEQEKIVDQTTSISMKFTTFNLPFLSLPVSTPKTTALDVFIKMNTSAQPLKIYDIVVAQVEASLDNSLHDLVADARKSCPAITKYYDLEDLTLYASALLQAKPPTYSTYMSNNFGKQLIENWETLLTGITRTVEFHQAERLFDSVRLPTDIVVPVLVALWALAPDGGDAEGRARSTLRKYLWRAFFSNRYEKSTNNRALADFKELGPLVKNFESSSCPTIFNDEEHPLPDSQELIAAGCPKRKDRIARAILALALKKGGLDLADGSTASGDNLENREYHHLFPVARLREDEVPNEKINLSLNCALVAWRTNRTFADKKPERYLTERWEGGNPSKAEVKERLESHLIPYEEMMKNDYNEFLNARAELIKSAMNKLCKQSAATLE